MIPNYEDVISSVQVYTDIQLIHAFYPGNGNFLQRIWDAVRSEDTGYLLANSLYDRMPASLRGIRTTIRECLDIGMYGER